MKFIIIFLIIIIAILIFIGNYFYNLSMKRGSNRDVIFNADHNQFVDTGVWKTSVNKTKEWLTTVSQEELFLQSRDGLSLHATMITQSSSTHQWMLGCHGYTSNNQETLTLGRELYAHGFNILVPDARGHGKSEGNYIGMGWPERLDIVDWVNFIVNQDPKAEIMLYGISMGAATVMNVAGEPLPQNVKLIIEDCGYSSTWGIFTYQLKSLFKIPAFPIMHSASLITKLRAGYWISDGSAIDQLKKCDLPMLFIHGSSDSFVPFEMLEEVYNSAQGPKEKYIVPNAAHAMSQYTNEEKYFDTILNFINQYM